MCTAALPPRVLMEASPLVFFGAFVVLAVLIAILSGMQAARRREALRKAAGELGLGFHADVGHSVHERYEAHGFSPFGQGSSRKTFNLLFGQRNGVYWELFDYRYTTGSGKNRTTHRRGIVAAQVPLEFPSLRMRPEGLFDKVKGFLGFDDIDFESEQFSSRYHVSCDDRKRAYDIIHPQVIEFLMAQPNRHWQLRGRFLVMEHTSPLAPSALAEEMQRIEQFLALLPGYVRDDLARPAPSQFPRLVE